MSVKAAPPMISGALNGPSGCLQYDERTTKHLVQYLTSMESCDVQDSTSTSYICGTSVHQSKQPLWWSLMRWMDHLAVCDMQDSDRTSYILVTSVHQSKWPLWWSLVFNGPSGCLWYDKRITKLSIEYLISLKRCDMQEANSISHIHATSIYQSMQAVQTSLGH